MTPTYDIYFYEAFAEGAALRHNAFNTLVAVERKAEQSIAAICAFRRSGQFPNPVAPRT